MGTMPENGELSHIDYIDAKKDIRIQGGTYEKYALCCFVFCGVFGGLYGAGAESCSD
jgi:hypothetical protein